MNELEASYGKAKDEGLSMRGMVVINPGNPTGQILPYGNMQEVINHLLNPSLDRAILL